MTDFTGINSETSTPVALRQLGVNDNPIVHFGENHSHKLNRPAQATTLVGMAEGHPNDRIALFLEFPPEKFSIPILHREYGISQKEVDQYLKTGIIPQGPEFREFQSLIQTARENNVSVYLVDSTKAHQEIHNTLIQTALNPNSTNAKLDPQLDARNKIMAERIVAIMSGDQMRADAAGYKYNVPKEGFDRAVIINGNAHIAKTHDMDEIIEKGLGIEITTVDLHAFNAPTDVITDPNVNYTILETYRHLEENSLNERLSSYEAADISINLNQNAYHRVSYLSSSIAAVGDMARYDKSPEQLNTNEAFRSAMQEFGGNKIERLQKRISAIYQNSAEQSFEDEVTTLLGSLEKTDPGLLYSYEQSFRSALETSKMGVKIKFVQSAGDAAYLSSNIADFARAGGNDAAVNKFARALVRETSRWPEADALRKDLSRLYHQHGNDKKGFEAAVESHLKVQSLKNPVATTRLMFAIVDAAKEIEEIRNVMWKTNVNAPVEALEIPQSSNISQETKPKVDGPVPPR